MKKRGKERKSARAREREREREREELFAEQAPISDEPQAKWNITTQQRNNPHVRNVMWQIWAWTLGDQQLDLYKKKSDGQGLL